MIIEEVIGINLIKHYSNIDVKIRQIETDRIYEEAVDAIPCRYTYAETIIPIETPKEPPDSWDEAKMAYATGVNSI